MVGMIVKGRVKDTLENSIFRESKEASISGPDLEIKGKGIEMDEVSNGY